MTRTPVPTSNRGLASTLDESVATVWLVDDSPLQGEVSRATLARRHRVVVFDRAAPMLERLSAGERPDILVLDWHMPEVSGVEACRFVRTMADGAELPIIFLTATGDHRDLLEGLGAGANDFVRKPADGAEIHARIAGLVRTKRLHARLAATEAALRDEATFRERFLAILAHDLRQPLNIYALGIEALAASDTPPEVREKVKAIFEKATGRMQRMIGELLDFSRSRPHGGGMHVVLQPLDLGVVVRDVIDEVRLGHPKRKIELDVVGRSTGHWDGDRMAQVVSNLVENALSHSAPESPVSVGLTAAATAVAVTVENHGEPLAPEVVATIFDPFRRGSSQAVKDRGLGLGLYIVEQVVKAHGGTVSVESSDGRTRFNVVLPVAAAKGSTVAPLILLVDDDADARALCAASLLAAGFRVQEAADGVEALSRIAESPPDLIFMDLAMPRMDGWEATRLIKADPLTRGIVVIVLTNAYGEEALARAHAAGAEHASRKLSSNEEIVALARKHLDRAA